MTDRFGSHWRWRLAMLLVAFALIGYGRWQAERWQWRSLVQSGGSPAIYRSIHRDGSQSIEAFDWEHNQRWMVTTLPPDGRRRELDDVVGGSPEEGCVVPGGADLCS